MNQYVDLNSDIGEGFGAWTMGPDGELLEIVSSANIACGFHAGDPGTMRRTCADAVRHGVAIGAQVGYPDLLGFGRRFLDMAAGDLRDAVLAQIGALEAFARVGGGKVTYVKPHGALYNAVVHHEEQAEAVVRAVHELGPGLAVLGLPGSALLRRAEAAGLRTVGEAFADRAYTPDGRLVSRQEPGAVLHGADRIAARVVGMVLDGTVEAVDGSLVRLAPQSICVHGDSPGAVEIARAVRSALADAGVTLRPFAP
jgi:UPF0271 protein